MAFIDDFILKKLLNQGEVLPLKVYKRNHNLLIRMKYLCLWTYVCGFKDAEQNVRKV